MTVRDQLCSDKAHYDQIYDYNVDWLLKQPHFLANDVLPNRMGSALAQIYETKVVQLILRYSRGDSLEAMRDDLIDVLESYVAADEKMYEIGGGHIYAPDVIHAKTDTTLAFCFGLGFEGDLLQSFLNCLVPEGKDTLTDRLIAVYQPSRKVGDPKKWRLAKEYQLLNEAIDAPPEQQVKLVSRYLEKFDKELKGYKRPLETNEGYIGLWCFELASIVKAFDIDDSAFIDSPYYPKDLVHYLD